MIFHSEGIEPPSQEPESYVISITLRVATSLFYQTLGKKTIPLFKLLFIC